MLLNFQILTWMRYKKVLRLPGLLKFSRLRLERKCLDIKYLVSIQHVTHETDALVTFLLQLF